MTVTFKPIKYKHQQQAKDLGRAIAEKTAADNQVIEFVVSLVASWDYIDDETGQAVPVGDYMELTVDQFNELMANFNARMQAIGVKKTKPTRSSSSSTRSRTASKPR